MTTPPAVRANFFRTDAERSLYLAAERLYWAEKAAAEKSGAGAGVFVDRRATDARLIFADMLRGPENIAAAATLIADVVRLRQRVFVLRAAIAGDPKDLAEGMPDGLTPIGTLEAAVRYAVEAFKVTRAIDADPAATEDMLTDASNFLEALRGALELTKD